MPGLPELLSLKGTIVTADALSCQRGTAGAVPARGGDCVPALKGDQGTLRADVSPFLDDPRRTREAGHTTVDGGHGRIETRTGLVSTDVAWLRESRHRPGLAAAGRTVRTREVGAEASTGAACHLPSAPLRAERFAEVARARWGIGNGPPRVPDVVVNEDRARSREDRGPESLALLRRPALDLARLEPSKGPMKGKPKRAGWDNASLARLPVQLARPEMRSPTAAASSP